MGQGISGECLTQGIHPRRVTVGKTRDGAGADHGPKPLPAPCQTERSTLVSVTCGHYRAIEQTSQSAVADHQPLFSSRACAGQGFRRTVLALGAPVRKLGVRAVCRQLSWGSLALLPALLSSFQPLAAHFLP